MIKFFIRFFLIHGNITERQKKYHLLLFLIIVALVSIAVSFLELRQVNENSSYLRSIGIILFFGMLIVLYVKKLVSAEEAFFHIIIILNKVTALACLLLVLVLPIEIGIVLFIDGYLKDWFGTTSKLLSFILTSYLCLYSYSLFKLKLMQRK